MQYSHPSCAWTLSVVHQTLSPRILPTTQYLSLLLGREYGNSDHTDMLTFKLCGVENVAILAVHGFMIARVNGFTRLQCRQRPPCNPWHKRTNSVARGFLQSKAPIYGGISTFFSGAILHVAPFLEIDLSITKMTHPSDSSAMFLAAKIGSHSQNSLSWQKVRSCPRSMSSSGHVVRFGSVRFARERCIE